MTFKDKVALVTGSAGGLGHEIATAYLSKGASVVVCDINPKRLATVEAELSEKYPGKALVTEVNVTDEESVKNLISSAVDKFGRLDFVVNNAGIMDHFDPAGSCDKSMWDKVLAVNLTGPFLVTKYAVQVMEKQQSGIIINIGSNASLRGLAAGVAYSAAKHGILALTKNTAGFYGPKGISSVALLLGAMDTTNISEAFSDGINMEGMGRMRDTQPGLVSVPTDHVAQYATFLSDEGIGKSSNGTCIVLNKNWPVA